MDDWHVLLLGFFEGGDQSFNMQDAEEILSRWNATLTLTLAGESDVLDTIQTATKPLLLMEDYGFDKVYGFQVGQIVPAGAFPIGEYTLAVVVEFDGTLWFESSIQFFIDPSGSATCAQ